MKMMYQIKPNNRNNSTNNFLRFFVMVVIVGLVILFSVYSSSSSASNLLSPFVRMGNYFYGSILRSPNIFSSKDNLIKENKKLSDEIENLSLNIVDYNTIKEENVRLYKELGLRPSSSFIGAKVLAIPPQIPLDLLLLDRGSEDLVKEGDLVLVSDRVLIGKIVKVSKNTSTVALNSFPEVVQYGYVERTKEPIEVKGIGGGNIQAKVPIEFDIIPQDKIIVETGKALVVAIVQVVEEDQLSGFKNVLMMVPANISKTKIVFISPYFTE